MAQQSAKMRGGGRIARGSDNVFADLNFPDAEERQTKLRLAYALNTAIEKQKLTQGEAALRLGLN